ncbi:MAG: hypothetical protein P1U74_02560 [Legionellaceae bacterium]|nr:hypothetical protein [Legionellaceae bacterium]
MLFHTASGYTPVIPQDAYRDNHTVYASSDVNKHTVECRRICNEALKKALESIAAEAKDAVGYRSFCPKLIGDNIYTLEKYTELQKSYSLSSDNKHIGKKLVAIYKAHDANLNILETYTNKEHAHKQLMAILNKAGKSQPQETQTLYIWSTIVLWFSAFYYRSINDAIIPLKTVLENMLPKKKQGCFSQGLRAKPYFFTDLNIKALQHGALSDELRTFINNGSADILVNTHVRTIPELINQLKAQYKSPKPIKQDTVDALKELLSKYLDNRIGSSTPSQYNWAGMFSCFPSAKSLDEKISAIEKLCAKIDAIPEFRSNQTTLADFLFPLSRRHHNGYSRDNGYVEDRNKFNARINTCLSSPFTPIEKEILANGKLGKSLLIFVKNISANFLYRQNSLSIEEFLDLVEESQNHETISNYSF